MAKGKKKKPITPEQREKRKLKRKAARKRAAARKAGKVVATGKGDYNVGYVLPSVSRNRLRGRGDYVDDFVSGGANLVSHGIKKAGGWLADKVLGGLGSLFGIGDYVSHNAVPNVNSMWHQQIAPVIVSDPSRPNIFQHTEMITNITSSPTYVTRSFALNPGLPQVFTWLSQLARAYAQFKLLGAAVIFKTECEAYGGADVNGKVLLSTRYDVTQPEPTSVVQIENQQWTVVGRPVDNLMMAIECDPALRPVNIFEVRSGAIPDSADQQLFDPCIIDVTNIGQADTNITIGSVYITYEIEMVNPVDLDGASSAVLTDHYRCTDITTGSPGGVTREPNPDNGIGGVLLANGQYVFPSWVTEGSFLLVWDADAVTSISADATFTYYACDHVTTIWNFDTYLHGRAGAFSFAATIVHINGPSASVQVDFKTIVGECVGDLVVVPWQADIIALKRQKARFKRFYDSEDKRNRLLVDLTASRLKPAVADLKLMFSRFAECFPPETRNAILAATGFQQEIEPMSKSETKRHDDESSDSSSGVMVEMAKGPRFASRLNPTALRASLAPSVPSRPTA